MAVTVTQQSPRVAGARLTVALADARTRRHPSADPVAAESTDGLVRRDKLDQTCRYVRASGDGHITLEGSNSILGTWTSLGNLSGVGHYNMGGTKKRHGSILNLTAAEDSLVLTRTCSSSTRSRPRRDAATSPSV